MSILLHAPVVFWVYVTGVCVCGHGMWLVELWVTSGTAINEPLRNVHTLTTVIIFYAYFADKYLSIKNKQKTLKVIQNHK
ncbi:hypothetical protein FR483_n499L [Paramecium bursaria Chlorella virus FR483]|uniref:Uncharacterized protein n499L n=1 Tax=Paramecium bursaria Chlorella virus FR483 TaxID=399781 RepID=A7J7K3_PBCVF|nr:hypothetical protein FR483_n499L [Paramecium bursaria Chlorella virus FR483]ABT15784.1 hypothetical protein FR483_n499L [Paramecium bursaria Chlorella virus FR483]